MHEEELIIAVMGPTGSGKTTFINVASGSNLLVGQGLRSTTESVYMTSPFRVDGLQVRLVDTPGFDDTTRSDLDILRTIADYLTSAYKEGKTLAGVIYIHRISDFRMNGISRKNFRMFRKICGESTLKNVVIMTNMWGSVETSLAEAREAELANEEVCFKPVLDAGAKMLRHFGTRDSAHEVLRYIASSRGGPVVLALQKEIVVEHKTLERTAAADACRDEMAKEAEIRHQEELERTRRQNEEVLRRREEEVRRRAEEEAWRRQQEIERAQANARRVAEELERQRQEYERRMQEQQRMAQEAAKRAQEEQERRLRAEEARRRQQEIEQAQARARRAAELERQRREHERWMQEQQRTAQEAAQRAREEQERQRELLEWEARCAAERAEREMQELQHRINEERRRQEERDDDDGICRVQ